MAFVGLLHCIAAALAFTYCHVLQALDRSEGSAAGPFSFWILADIAPTSLVCNFDLRCDSQAGH
jgi:hypothetical protein